MSIRPNSQYLAALSLAPQPDLDPSAQADAIDAAEPVIGERIEIRYETLSPVEEYAIRDGVTESLHEEFQAVLCNDYRGSGTVTADGIKIKDAALVGHARRKIGVTYWHPDSDLCNRIAEGPVKVYYTFNPARPEVVHLWDMSWRYLETLPEKTKVSFLDSAGYKEIAQGAKRQIKRFTDALQKLHESDTSAAVDQLCHNAAAMDRVAVSLDLPAESAPRARTVTVEPTGFDRAAVEGEVILTANHRTQSLRTQAERDHLQIDARRRAVTPATVAAYDPLNDL